MLARGDLAASYFTLTGAGVADPSRHPLPARLAAARAAGFTGLALAPGEAAGADLGDLRALVDEHGLAVTELEPLRGWDGDDAPVADEYTLYAMADVFGSRQINAIRVVGPEVDDAVVARRFAAVCDRAAEHGVTVAFEPRANSPVDTPAGAADLLHAADRPNAGMVLDAYHVHRAGVTLDDLRAAGPELVVSVQLNDMNATPHDDAAVDALQYRLVPGDGDIDLPGWLAGLRGLGVDVPLAVEVMSREFFSIPLDEAARRAADGARAALAAARVR